MKPIRFRRNADDRCRTAWSVGLLVLLCVGAPADPVEEPSARVLVVFHSVGGNTRAMAEAVAEGARAIDGVEVKLRAVADATPENVVAADAVIVGSPVHNANVTPEIQAFINDWPFRGSPLKDKLGAAFVTAGGISAGEEAAQLSILRSMLVFGMVVIGGDNWMSAFGASAITEEEPFEKGGPAPEFLDKGKALGRRVASLAVRYRAGDGLLGAPEGLLKAPDGLPRAPAGLPRAPAGLPRAPEQEP